MSRRANRVALTHFLSGVGVSLDNLEPIVERRSRKYNLSLYRHSDFGKVLVLDEEIQHVEAWSALYHETLIHFAASFVRVVKSVAILGGGSLFAALEALKYSSVQRVIMLDHDPLGEGLIGGDRKRSVEKPTVANVELWSLTQALL